MTVEKTKKQPTYKSGLLLLVRVRGGEQLFSVCNGIAHDNLPLPWRAPFEVPSILWTLIVGLDSS